MLFSYYFDTKKTHTLDCRFQVNSLINTAGGGVQVNFDAIISEVKGGVLLKKETKAGSFTFAPTATGGTQHDIDFTRVRFGEQKKWIFTVINNKNPNQTVEVGLISETARKNPLGLDIHHDNENFEAELKANNLAMLSQSFQPPVLTQTIAASSFDQSGFPERFNSIDANYDNTYKNYQLTNFEQQFLEPIPAGSKFKIQMDIAPRQVVPLTGMKLFDLLVPGLGRFSLLKQGIEYMKEDGTATDVKRIMFLNSVQPSDFWNGTRVTNLARLTIEGDGAGNLMMSYYGQILTGRYDYTKRFSGMTFKGALARIN